MDIPEGVPEELVERLGAFQRQLRILIDNHEVRKKGARSMISRRATPMLRGLELSVFHQKLSISKLHSLLYRFCTVLRCK